MLKQKKGAVTAGARSADTLPAAFYEISSLLHTTRRIAQHEDTLCMIQHEIKQTGNVSPALAKELGLLLDELPGDEYLSDIEALQISLARSTKVQGKRSRAKVAAKSVKAKQGHRRKL